MVQPAARCAPGCATIGLILLAGTAADALAAEPLAPWKDELFLNEVVETRYDGDYRFIRYDRERDIFQRDDVPEKRAFAKYVALEPTETQRDLVLRAGSRAVRYVGVGKAEGGARFVVIFLHGGKGSRFQGVDDWTFGGNFNRLRNLVFRNGGAYLSADFANFGRAGAADVKALIMAERAVSADAPIILVCTSRSGEHCFRMIEDEEAAALLGGIVLLGSGNEDGFFATPAFARRVPIYIGHGSGDSLITWVTQELFFKAVKERAPDYPIRFDLFLDGSHGTPTRLIDWRRVLNWMLAARPG